jgi:serine/threonine protein kinase
MHSLQKLTLMFIHSKKGNLAKVISEKKRFNHEQIYEWSCEMIEAINYLHLNQIIHRNIKPSYIIMINLLIIF